MDQDDREEKQDHRDFFISYTSVDRQWAEWIALQLEHNEQYTTFIQAWDFRPGSNFVAQMHWAAQHAERTLLVLSPAYLESCRKSGYTLAEWATAFCTDPTGENGRLVPVRIQSCEINGLLGPVVALDLVSLDEEQARERLLVGVRPGRAKPGAVPFPGKSFLPESPTPVPFPGSQLTHWHVPFARNPFFTGRDREIQYLHAQLQKGDAPAPKQIVAISGLGGMGKTQLVLEYAYRHRDAYQCVFWMRAETYETLTADLITLAHLLELPTQETRHGHGVRKAVKCWLDQHRQWLLILDDIEDFSLLSEVVPAENTGHIVATTRTQSTGLFAQRLELERMDPDEGTLFLLQRAKYVSLRTTLEAVPEASVLSAREIYTVMDGLPLALDQAGAYIEETGCGLCAYLDRYQNQREAVLDLRGEESAYHPQSISTTILLSCAKIRQMNQAAMELLECCAFLQPDAIPEELLTEGARYLGPVLAPVMANALQRDAALAVLRKYSLIRRNPETHILTLHRLVQAVVKDCLDEEKQRRWAERVIEVIHQVFSKAAGLMRRRCQRYLLQAQIGAILIEQWHMTSPEAIRFLTQAGAYFVGCGQFTQAEALLHKGLKLAQKRGDEGQICPLLYHLAMVEEGRGNFAEGEAYISASFQLAQKLGQQEQICSCFTGLGVMVGKQGKHSQAKDYFQKGLALAQKLNYQKGIMVLLLDLGRANQELGNLVQSREYYRQSLEMARRLGHELLQGIAPLFLGIVAMQQGHFVQSQELLEGALIRLRHLGSYPWLEEALLARGNLALIEEAFESAEGYFREGLELAQRFDHRKNMSALCDALGRLETRRGNYGQAKAHIRDALRLGRDAGLIPQVCMALHSWGELQMQCQCIDDASTHFREMRDLSLKEQPELLALALYGLARVARDRHDLDEARRQGEASLTLFTSLGHYYSAEVRRWLDQVLKKRKL